MTGDAQCTSGENNCNLIQFSGPKDKIFHICCLQIYFIVALSVTKNIFRRIQAVEYKLRKRKKNLNFFIFKVREDELS